MKNRRKAREVALTVLYQYEVGLGDSVEETYQQYLYNNEIPEKVKDYLGPLLSGISEKWSFLDEIIRKYSKGWTLERMLILDRNILRIALFEIFFKEDVPVKVSINEAVEIARMFSGEESRKFINGILDRVYKDEL
jgi:N utilization substance protein B